MAVERDLPVIFTPRRRSKRPSRAFRRVRALLAGGLVFGVGATMTLAAWTDQEFANTTVTAGTFSIVSRIDQGAFSAHPDAATAVVVPLDAGAMYPGLRKAAYVQVQASGSIGGTVNLTAVSVTNAGGGTPTGADLALQNALTVGVAVVPNIAACTTTAATPSTPITSVPVLVAQPVTVGPLNIVTYCIVLELPASAPNAAQGGTVKPTWTFTGSTN